LWCGLYNVRGGVVKKLQIPLAIQWSEGLLLYPQHFQQQRRVLHSFVTNALSVAEPFYWGVRSVSYDESSLLAETLRVEKLEAVMPDGAFVCLDDGEVLELDLQSKKEMCAESPQTVFLALPKEHEGSADNQSEAPRYSAVDAAECVDENTSDNPVQVPRLKPCLCLMMSKVPVTHAAFPLCALSFINGSFVMVDFLPPMITLDPQQSLFSRVHAVLEVMRERVGYLVERLQAPLDHETTTLLEKYRSLYGILVRPLYVLDALVYQQATHPYTLYLELCRVCGDVSAVVPGRMPRRLPPYDHNQPLASFEHVLGVLKDLLAMVEKPSLNIPFMEEAGVFYLRLSESWLSGNTIMLSVHPDKIQDTSKVMEWVKGALVISKSLVKKSQSRRVLGAERVLVDQDEQLGLVRTESRLLVKITLSPDFIVPDEELCLVNLSRVHIPPKQIYLCVQEQ